jgi:DedD protein
MNEKNELSDIVLNKSNSSSSNKKIILAIATLGVVLIIVVMVMNSMNSGTKDNLPQAVLPPKPQTEVAQDTNTDEPLFEDVQVMQDDASSDADLDQIAQKLKQESNVEQKISTPEPEKVAPVVTKKVTKKVAVTTSHPKVKKAVTKVSSATGSYYIQVGSFSRYEPNKKFLKSIKDLGFDYKYHKVGSLNKVLVGPFPTAQKANSAKRVIRSKIEPGAFLVKL